MGVVPARAEQPVAPAARAEAARLNNVGTALMNQQLLEAAAAKFAEAARLDPTLTAAQVNEGIALLYQQKTAEAEHSLRLAVERQPADTHAWYALGLLYRSQSQAAEATGAFRRVLAVDPGNADSHYFLGSLLLDARDLPAAVAEFREALRLAPMHASAEFGLARALQRQGQTAEARAALDRFQHLTEAKLAFPITSSYGEEGDLARAEDTPSGAISEAGPMIPVRFVPSAGLGVGAAGAEAREGCLLDLDGRLTLIQMTAAPSALSVFQADGTGLRQVPAGPLGLSLAGNGIACAAGDFDNDGLTDLAVALSDRLLLFRNLGNGKFEDVTQPAGIRLTNAPTGLLFVDYDHDGDLDLLVTGAAATGLEKTGTPNALWRNNGDKTFTNWTEQAGLGGVSASSAAMLSDLNNDRAIDLLVTGSGAAPAFYANPREGAFTASPLYTERDLPPTRGVAIFDYNKDGWMDVALIHAGKPGVSLWRNVDGKRFERVLLPALDAVDAWGIAALDFDNDGWIDLAVGIRTPQGPALKIFRNRGSAAFEDVTTKLGLDGVLLGSPTGLLASDFAGQGAPDLIVTQASGAPLWLRNEGGNRNHSLRIVPRGLADNKSGIGTKVEVFANGLWQKWEITNPTGILAGLGTASKADLVRMLWPTGVPQDEIEVAATHPGQADKPLAELDRRGSSCPTLFAWDGGKFRFVADVIGAGVVGHWVAPHERNTPDPDEWIKVDGAALKPRGGKLGLRFGEPMEEVNFVDQVRLVAVDHPAGTEVYPNERFLSEPPFAPADTIVSRDARPPRAATDDRGRNVLPLLARRDRRYVKDFTNLPYAGFANRHALTLDLGDLDAHQPLHLLLHGFVEYFSASSMYAAWQAGIAPLPPYVEAQLPDGSPDGTWKRIIDDMGFPAGLPRTIVVDLTGKMPPGSHRIRIVTNLQIYWDQALVDTSPAPEHPAIRQTELPLVSAQLAFRGYPLQQDGRTSGDLRYEYARKSRTGPFVPQAGAYTRYGNVTPLLKTVDDEYVVFGTGEDMDLEFAASAAPPLPSGWVRDYFFYANGFVKDMDFYESSPFTVTSLPFHGMSGYPYPAGEHYPSDAEHLAYQLEWNDRFVMWPGVSGAAPASYRFHYVPNHD